VVLRSGTGVEVLLAEANTPHGAVGYLLTPIDGSDYLYGGPDAEQTVTPIHTNHAAGAIEVAEGIFIGGDRNAITDYQLIKGSYRWGPHQLEAEMSYKQAWVISDIVEPSVFTARLGLQLKERNNFQDKAALL
jgi:putative AlgH/UPF0301 family transcriptional regulator